MSSWRRWKTLWKAMGAAGDSRAAWRELRARYGEPVRAYHTLRHVESCLAGLDRLRRRCSEPAAVELALWFHDAVYDPHASDNEARSAELLLQASLRMGIDPALGRSAERLVLATAHLAAPSEATGDSAVIHDLDLAILGAPSRRFDQYERRVRAEYAHLSDAQWASGRSRVLQGFLSRPRIYLTDELHAGQEARARTNLQRSLDRLTSPGGASPAGATPAGVTPAGASPAGASPASPPPR